MSQEVRDVAGGGMSEADTAHGARRARFPASWLGGLALVLVCLAVYVPGMFGLPAVDRDESRFAQASRQMAESTSWRGWIVPRVQDKPRLNKPPLIYWLQAASVRLFTDAPPQGAPGAVPSGADGAPARPLPVARHDAIWMYRVPSLVAALLAAFFTWRIGLRMFDARAALLAALLLAICPLMIWESKQARSDMVLLACTTCAMGALWRIYHASVSRPGGEAVDITRRAWVRRAKRRGGAVLIFWVAMTLGVLVKGPLTPLVAGLACLLLCVVERRWRWLWSLRPVPGVLLVSGAIGTWAWFVAREVGVDAYVRTVTDEVLGRSVSAKEGHWGPPGYHLVALVALFWPGVLLTGAAIGRGFRLAVRKRPTDLPEPNSSWVSRRRHAIASRAPGRRAELFCIAWAVPSWIVFELVGTKLPHYTLPLYPALALLSARAVYAAHAGRLKSAATPGARIGYELWTIVGLAIVGAPLGVWWLLSTETEEKLGVVGIATALAGAAWIFVAHHALRTRLRRRGHAHFVHAQLCGLVAAGFAGMVLCGVVLPALSRLATSRRAAAVIRFVDPAGTRPVVCVGYQEDSLIFETHGRARRIELSQLQPVLDADPSTIVVASAEALADRTDFTTLADLSGFNYAKGDRVRVLVCEKKPESLEGPRTPER